MALNTAVSDFPLAAFTGSGEPVTLYVAPPYHDLETLTPLLRMMLALLIRQLTDDHAGGRTGRTREHVSQLADDTTVRYRHWALSRGGGSRFLSNATFSDAEARRALFTSAEVGLLPRNRMILLKTGLPPVLAHRLPYFEDDELSQRARIKPPVFISARPDRLPLLPDLSDSLSRIQRVQEPQAKRDSRRPKDDEREGDAREPGGGGS